MLPALLLLTCFGPLGAEGSAPPPALELPKPHFQPQPDDPAWLIETARFHGHLGPSVVAGARFGMAGLKAVGAGGYFDVEVTCEGPFVKPPQSCFLDGLQVGTGATLGKRSLQWTPGEQILVRVKNTRSGKTVELRPTAALIELLGWSHPQAKKSDKDRHDHTPGSAPEALARKIAAMGETEIIAVRLGDKP